MPKGDQWTLVLMDNFTRWQDVIAIPNANAHTVATAFEEHVFCYVGLPEEIHTDQRMQFEYWSNTLMNKLFVQKNSWIKHMKQSTSNN